MLAYWTSKEVVGNWNVIDPTLDEYAFVNGKRVVEYVYVIQVDLGM